MTATAVDTALPVHAKRGASSSHRWFKCAGSIRMSEGMPNESSIFAAEGTGAHSVGETCLRDKFNADQFLGQHVHVMETPRRKDTLITRSEECPIGWRASATKTFEISDEMVEAVQDYLDAVRQTLKPGDIMSIEQKFDLSKLYPGMYGTADCVIYRPSTGELFVFDFKYGQGVVVDVVDNEQQLFYALGAALHEEDRCLTNITMTIVQPRAYHASGGVRKWSISAIDLLDWSADLIDAARRTDDPNAPLVAGDHCKFCPAAAVCPALKEHAYQVAKADFTPVGSELILSPANTFSGQALSDILLQVDVLEGWIKAVRAFAHHEADHGRCPPGFKLVAKKANRKWKDFESAKEVLIKAGIPEDQLYKDPSPKTPAMIEAVIKPALGLKGKAATAYLAEMVESPSSGSTLVPEDDARPALKADPETEFLPVND